MQNKTDTHNTVLVVEDDNLLNKLICTRLIDEGFLAKSASNGIECVNNLLSKEFKVLLIDYKLPDLSIEEILNKLKEAECAIPFVVMTGYGDEKIAVSVMKLGAKDYIIKDAQFITRLPEVIKRVIHEVESEKKLIDLKNSLIENEERLRLFTEHTKDIIVLVDRNGSIKWSNAAWKSVYGDNYTSLPTMKNLLHQKDIGILLQSWNRLLSHDIRINNLTYHIKDNTQDRYNVYESTVFPLTIKEERLFYIISRDVTENIETEKKNKWVEEQLQYTKSMELLSKVTSGIAEHFNNILTGISGYANLLVNSILAKTQSEYAQKIYELAMQGGEINTKLAMFAHQKNNIEVVSIHSVIHSVLDNMRKNWDVSIETSLKAGMDDVNADRTFMEMAIRNILINAYEAIPEKGKIIIRTELEYVDSCSDPLSSDNKKNNGFLKISIKDTGIGVSKNSQAKIFEPFFTTKKGGYCNGLGLSTVYRYLKQLNGSISIQSESGQGSEFKIKIPLADESNNPQLDIKDLHRGKTCGSVLVIDDELFVRETTAIILKRLGCSVKCCEDGQKGYAYFLNNHSKIDLVILDLLMPNMNGNICFHKLREVSSNIPIIISSAFSDEKIVRELHLHKSVYFLRKPYTIKKLSNIIGEVVRGK